MPGIYADGNYIVINDDTVERVVAKADLRAISGTDSISVTDVDKSFSVNVPDTDATSWDSAAGSASQYASAAALRTFLRANTGA